jgi:cysteinyl-tRNA synthetase
MRFSRALAAAVAASLLAGPTGECAGKAKPPQATAREVFRNAKSWGYQLQDIDVGKLARSTYDVLVIDVGDGSSRLARADIARLKRKPDGTRRLVVVYLNVGEAEDYRSYWRKEWETRPPDWLGAENCRWKGDHRVQHWRAEWREILYRGRGSALARLLALGVDGVWLDRVDIFYHWLPRRWQAAREMVELVRELAAAGRAINPELLVVPQNGEELLSDPGYREVIDGIGKEDLLYGDRGNDVANAPERVARAERNLAPARAARLPVLAVEYAREPANRGDAARRLAERGHLGYLGPRSLAYLGNDGRPHPEDGDSEPIPADADEACQ